MGAMSDLKFRRAIEADLPSIVELLRDDVLGSSRELSSSAGYEQYLDAFRAIDSDKNQILAVADDNGEIVGTLQLTFITGLSRGGLKRGQIEAVRIASHRRGKKLGEKMFEWAVSECRNAQCGIVQLTTDKSRVDAHRFYEKLGFKPSHIGYKLELY